MIDSIYQSLYPRLSIEAAKGADGALAELTRCEKLDVDDKCHTYGFKAAEYSGKLVFKIKPGQSAKDAAKAAVDAVCAARGTEDRQRILDAYERFRADHPEVFWMSPNVIAGNRYSYEYSYTSTDGSAEWKMMLYLQLYKREKKGKTVFDAREEEYRSVEAIRRGIAVRDERISSIISLSEIRFAMGDAGKVQALNRLLTMENGYYSGRKETIPSVARTCMPALVGSAGKGGAVCAGYARTFKVLCDRLAIPCVTISGDGYSNGSKHPEPHMWNAVRISGKWYGVDVTWNDPTITGISSAQTGYECEDYLLVGSDTMIGDRTFAQSHVPKKCDVADGIIPELAKYEYSGIDRRH